MSRRKTAPKLKNVELTAPAETQERITVEERLRLREAFLDLQVLQQHATLLVHEHAKTIAEIEVKKRKLLEVEREVAVAHKLTPEKDKIDIETRIITRAPADVEGKTSEI